MNAALEKKKAGYSPAYIINVIITLALMFGFGFLPPIGGITPIGMKVLGCFLGLVYAYSAKHRIAKQPEQDRRNPR